MAFGKISTFTHTDTTIYTNTQTKTKAQLNDNANCNIFTMTQCTRSFREQIDAIVCTRTYFEIMQ